MLPTHTTETCERHAENLDPEQNVPDYVLECDRSIHKRINNEVEGWHKMWAFRYCLFLENWGVLVGVIYFQRFYCHHVNIIYVF